MDVDHDQPDPGRRLQWAVMAGRVVVGGGALVAPQRTGAAFGVDPVANPAGSYLGRLFGVRALLQVALLATADPEQRRRQLRWGVAVDLVDAAAAAAAGRHGGLTRRAAGMATVAALTEAALGYAALTAGRVSSGTGSPRR